ncbi:MAG: hypothetical protein FVQ80_07615 [Planctomycetes bacterium]|nr:hypothetical protein [Planctomycetota bacterium]
MFTEIDYENYFNAIQQIEEKMLHDVEKIISQTSDAELLEILNGIREDEIVHLHLVDELFALLASSAKLAK